MQGGEGGGGGGGNAKRLVIGIFSICKFCKNKFFFVLDVSYFIRVIAFANSLEFLQNGNDDYLSIPERPGSFKYLFHEIPVITPGIINVY